FSTYRAGFEIRTYRLCRRFLMFHDFEGELGPGPRLVRSTDLSYDEEPAVSLLREVVHRSYAPGQEPAAMPPVRFAYSRPQVDESVRTIEPEELHAVPDGRRSRWFDLEGEGLTGILTQHDDAWYYQPNLGGGRFGPRELVASLPSIADVGDPHQQLSDLHGDGRVDLRVTTPALSGYYERGEAGDWDPFVPFRSIPGIDWGDPNLRAIDLTGDGRPDLLITEDDCLRWYASAGEDGYEAAQRLARALDEEAGPAIVFADATQSIHLADMTGDGLTDIVRIRNGEICYWRNTGYGTFGAKVTMDRAPVFDAVDQFDPRRIRLGDIDGTGTTDVLYIGPDRLRYWQNQAGNAWSEAHELREFPRVDHLAAVDVMDLLGAGTACVVWSSTLPADRSAPVHYIALMSEGKPYLLTELDNGVGATTRIRYAPSTRFYLRDRQAGRPWVTRLPFPVHVVERVETYDAIKIGRAHV